MKLSDYFPYVADDEKIKALNSLQEFLESPKHQVFILTGYAGSGKTTLLKAVVQYLKQKGRSCSLMASTGRAAKILRDKTQTGASTVHLGIYTLAARRNNDGYVRLVFRLAFNSDKEDAVYIIDEASMISNRYNKAGFADFGSGRLLTDIISFAGGRKVIFVGDAAQLPPVNSNLSPALDADYLRSHFDLAVTGFHLKNIHRQTGGNSIISLIKMFINTFNRQLHNTRPLRYHLGNKGKDMEIFFQEYKMIEDFCSGYEKVINTDKIMLALSNKKVNALNYFARQNLFHQPGIIEPGDIMINYNNNYKYEVLNGDTVRIIEPDLEIIEKAGLTFSLCRLEVSRIGLSTVLKAYVLKDFITREKPQLTPEEEKNMMIDFNIRMKKIDITPSMERPWLEHLKTDPFLNAFKLRYGYALTAHKAQGGEWKEVYVLFEDYFHKFDFDFQHRWAYTAVTRASQKLNMISNRYINS